jgi:hypothetical protein
MPTAPHPQPPGIAVITARRRRRQKNRLTVTGGAVGAGYVYDQVEKGNR